MDHPTIGMVSAPSDGDCYIDDLPDEIFAQILNLLPIKLVIRCSIVSKRWDAACRYLIRTCGSLSIGNDSYHPDDDVAQGWGWFWERPSVRLSSSRSLVPAMMRSLNQMEDLTRLCVIDHGLSHADISPFIRKFSDQLTMLEIDFAISMIGADVFPHLTRLRCRFFDANSSAAFPKLAELLVCGLENNERLLNMRLPSLTKLIVKDFGAGHAVRWIILANAKTLTVLEMSRIPLRFDRAVVFPNLKKLNCLDMDDAGRYALPALTHLTVGRPVTAEFLSSLPADQMLSLEVNIIEGGKDAVSAISKMKNLRSLKLTAWGEEDDTFSSIFDNMHHLEAVHLVVHDDSNEDRMIATLANQNPKLTHIDFDGIRVSDAGLTSLAQLQHLTDIRISHTGHQRRRVTTAGVLTLLRGSSRYVIRNFFIDCKQRLTGSQVESEIKRMCDERFATFRSKGDRFSHSFQFIELLPLLSNH